MANDYQFWWPIKTAAIWYCMLFQLLIATFYSTNLFIQSPELSHAQLPYNQAHAVQSYVNKHPFNSLSPLDLEVFDYIIFSQLMNEKPWHIYFQKYLQGIMHLGHFFKKHINYTSSTKHAHFRCFWFDTTSGHSSA